MKNFFLAATLIAALGATSLAQARSKELVEPARVTLPATAQPLSLEQVKQAIIKGGSRSGWSFQGESAGKLSLAFTKPKFEAVVDVSYDATGFQVRYARSINLGYKQEGDRAVIHPNYNLWVNSLMQAVSYEVSGIQPSATPIPEAASTSAVR